MPQSLSFGDVLDAADQLNEVEQRELIAILKRRLAVESRRRLINDVKESEEEIARGLGVVATPEEIMREIRQCDEN